jgi:hypothetical protein
MVNVCLRKFIKKPLSDGAWKDIPPNFGIIKGLHLEYLEFPNKIKKNAPIIPEPVYSGKADDEQVKPAPPPSSGGKKDKVPSKSEDKEGTSSNEQDDDDDDEEETLSSVNQPDEKELNFMDEFGATPQKKENHEMEWEEEPHKEMSSTPEKKALPKYVPVPKVEEHEEEKELDPTELYIREQVELRTNINDLKRLHEKGIDIGSEYEKLNGIDLQLSRILLETAKKSVSHKKSIDMNKFGLMGTFFAIDKGAGMMTDKMKGYFQYQMDIIHVYDDILEEMGETQINAILQDLDPTVKLVGLGAATTVGFYLLQNYIGEDKVKGAKLIQQFFPKQAKIIEEVTNASKKQKDEKVSAKKKRRGPSYAAEDINKL